jgi:hypothetical protein
MVRLLGIYGFGSGQLFTFPVSKVVPKRGLPKSIKWSKKRAKQNFG